MVAQTILSKYSTPTAKEIPMYEELTPNVRSLVIRKIALLMIPEGTKDDNVIATVSQAIQKPGNLKAVAKKALAWVKLAIDVVRNSPGLNPWMTASDEAIAGEILRRIDRKVPRKKARQK
jgi:hypothetical protein